MEHDSADDSFQDDAPDNDNELAQVSEHEQVNSYAGTEIPLSSLLAAQDHYDVPKEARWKRLRRHYNDEYLQLLISSQGEPDSTQDLGLSQLGTVKWTSLEKNTFFQSLALKGRLNLPEIAASVGTKSIVEIQDYLIRLKDADGEHQMFAKHAKNISLADMDAAIEINNDIETRLEQAADALAAYQDRFDLAQAKRARDLWLIDTATAKHIDEGNDAREGIDENELAEDTEDARNNEALEMFHFQTLLSLSGNIFMNSAAGSEHRHWTEYAEDNEEPSLTVDAAEVFYNLVKGLLQRVMQTSIFLAESRIRSTTTPQYTPSRILKEIDVTAALDVLSMPRDSWDYWTKFARRSGNDIILGDHRKGQNKSLSLAQVETALAVRSSRGRHRSLSAVLSDSSQEPDIETEADDEMQMSWMQENVAKSIEDSMSSTTTSVGEIEHGHPTSGTDPPYGNGVVGLAAEESDDSEIIDQPQHTSRKRRRILMEESQDRYVEELDRAAQIKEERFLEQILGSEMLKEEPDGEVPQKPRAQRKTKEDLSDWTDRAYCSLWEKRRLVREASERLSAEE